MLTTFRDSEGVVSGVIVYRAFFFFLFLFFPFFFSLYKFYFIFKLYIIVLVLPNIKMNPPQVYMCFLSDVDLLAVLGLWCLEWAFL